MTFQDVENFSVFPLTKQAGIRIINANITNAMTEEVVSSFAASRECLSRLQAGAAADEVKFPLKLQS